MGYKEENEYPLDNKEQQEQDFSDIEDRQTKTQQDNGEIFDDDNCHSAVLNVAEEESPNVEDTDEEYVHQYQYKHHNNHNIDDSNDDEHHNDGEYKEYEYEDEYYYQE